MLALPGAGGYQVTWEPGVRVFQLQPSPSGHLTLPCDCYEGNLDPAGHTILMADRLKNHTIQPPKGAPTPSPPKPSTAKASTATSDAPRNPARGRTNLPSTSVATPEIAIPMLGIHEKPLDWNPFQKKWRAYPKRDVRIAYWAQWSLTSPLSVAERRQEFAEKYPIHVQAARARKDMPPPPSQDAPPMDGDWTLYADSK